jgi:hypothetical protein
VWKSQYQALAVDDPLLGQRLMMLVFHDDAKREYVYGLPRGCRKPSSAHFPCH